MRTYKTEGIIVKRFNTAEADRILTVFTRDLGKCKVMAKGIRRVPSRRSGHVELLNQSILTLYQGRGMPILIEASTIESFRDVKDNLTKVGLAYHLCELIDGLCPESQELAHVYDLFLDTIKKLCPAGDDSISGIIHDFEVSLLVNLGYWKRDDMHLAELDTTQIFENVLERRLRSRYIFSRIDS